MIPYYTEKDKLDAFYNKFMELYHNKNTHDLADFILHEYGEFKDHTLREQKLHNVMNYLAILEEDPTFECKNQLEVDQALIPIWNIMIMY